MNANERQTCNLRRYHSWFHPGLLKSHFGQNDFANLSKQIHSGRGQCLVCRADSAVNVPNFCIAFNLLHTRTRSFSPIKQSNLITSFVPHLCNTFMNYMRRAIIFINDMISVHCKYYSHLIHSITFHLEMQMTVNTTDGVIVRHRQLFYNLHRMIDKNSLEVAHCSLYHCISCEHIQMNIHRMICNRTFELFFFPERYILI